MKTHFVLGSGFTFTLGLIAAQGCRYKESDPLHCANNDGDAYCAGQFDDGVQRYCQRGIEECYTPDSQYGCVEQRPADECYSPCGGRSTIDQNSECVMEEDSSSGSSSGTEASSGSSESSSTTGPLPCMGNEDCPDTSTPFCEPSSGDCVSCDVMKDPDGACMGLDPTKPVCVDGACVACTPENPAACTGTTPICDGATNTCVPCTAHEQCGGAACNLFTGACLPADAVVHVGGATPDFDDLTTAVASFDPDTEGTIIVHAGGSYDESVTVDGGRMLAFLAADLGPMVTSPQWVQTDGGANMPQLTVIDAAVLMDGLRLSGNQSATVPGLRVDGGRAWVDRNRIVGNTGGGVLAENGAELVLRNCFVGSDGNGISAVVLTDADASVFYSTMFSSAFAPTAAAACNGATTLILRNSIVATEGGALGDELSCSGSDVTYSATEALVPGEGNSSAGLFPDGAPEQWFSDVLGGDLGLQNDGLTLFADVAQWTTGDPLTDIDGDQRPAVDGTPDYAGADVP